MSTELIDQLINDHIPQFLDDLHSMRVYTEALEGDVSSLKKKDVNAHIMAARAFSLEEEADIIRQVAKQIDASARNLADSAERSVKNPSLQDIEGIIGSGLKGYREDKKTISFRTNTTLGLDVLQDLKDKLGADDIHIRGQFIDIIKGKA